LDIGVPIETRVAGGPTGAGDARRALMALERSLPAQAYAAIRLLVSQLVADARWHPSRAAPSLGLKVVPQRSFVRVEVTDIVDEPNRGPDQLAASGWDILLLDERSDRWGILEGTTSDVWFEIDLGP
jgi:hypothetical protein